MKQEWAGAGRAGNAGGRSWRQRDTDCWSALRDVGFERAVSTGAKFFVDVDPPRTVLLVESGLVKIVGVRHSGETVVLTLCRGGDVVSGPVSTGEPRSHLVALSPTILVSISAPAMRRLLLRRPELAMTVLDYAAERIHQAEQQRVEHIGVPASRRVRRTLAVLGGQFGPVVPISQSDLADLAGASREVTARVLRRLRDNGVVTTGRYRIEVVRPAEICGPEDRIDPCRCVCP